MNEDRRDSQRVAILGSLTGEIVVCQPMTVREIGINGATVETAFPLHLDSLHDLRMVLGNHSIVVKGRVVHARITDVDREAVIYLSGLEFVELSERVQRALADYIQQLKAKRSSPETSI